MARSSRFRSIGARNLAETRAADTQALNVKVTAFQWDWSFEYPDYGVTSRELYLPVNRQVLLSLTSRDVIHSFWVPEFRVKQDVLPGENLVKQLRITPIRKAITGDVRRVVRRLACLYERAGHGGQPG